MPLKFVTVNDNVFSFWGTSSPRPPRLCSSKISFKNPPMLATVQCPGRGVCCCELRNFRRNRPSFFRKYPEKQRISGIIGPEFETTQVIVGLVGY